MCLLRSEFLLGSVPILFRTIMGTTTFLPVSIRSSSNFIVRWSVAPL